MTDAYPVNLQPITGPSFTIPYHTTLHHAPYHTYHAALLDPLRTVQFSSGLMLVGVWLGLLWVLFYFFDHYIQSSGFLTLFSFPDQYPKVQFSAFSVCLCIGH